MSVVNSTECVICYNEYDTENRKPYIGTCGHTICENCRHQMVSSKCPQCNREEAFTVTTINYQVLELIKHFKSMQAGESSKQSLLDDPKGLDEGACSECTLPSSKLRLCMTCAVKCGVLKHDENRKEFVLNVENNDVEAALRNAKKIAICPDCDMVGVQHEGHKSMLLAVLNNNLDGRTPASAEEMTKAMQDEVGKRLKSKLKESIDLLNEYMERCDLLPASERKIHFKNFEAIIEKINDTMTLARDACSQLTAFSTMDPVLIADRKQCAHEPLLVSVFSPKDTVWTPIGRMPNPKSNYAVASNKTQIFIVGGTNNGSWLQNVEMYDRDKNLRRDCNRMKRGRSRAAAGFHNSKMYVAGGYDSTYMNSVEIFDPEHNDWKDGPPLQRPRADGAVVSCNGKLYVFGGCNEEGYEEKIEILNEITQEFEIVGEMQGSRAGFAACAFRGRIYIVGGWNSSSNILRSVRSYDPMLNSWRDEPSMNKARKCFTLHATSRFIYAIRGCADDGSLINDAEKFDQYTQRWGIISF